MAKKEYYHLPCRCMAITIACRMAARLRSRSSNDAAFARWRVYDRLTPSLP